MALREPQAGRHPFGNTPLKTGSVQLLIRQTSVLIYVAAQRFFFCCSYVAALCDLPSSDELRQADISRLLLLPLPRHDIKAKLQIQTD